MSLTLVAIVGASALHAQSLPPRDTRPVVQQPAAVGTASVTGVVTMGTGQPARKVRVSLSGSELHGSRSTTTDDQGRFSFTALPAGRFSLSASKPGHLSVTYGQRRPGTQGTQIQLSDGQTFQAQLQMPRGSVLTGAVLDEHGEAAPGTSVRAMRYVTQSGSRRLQSAGSSSTDDRGIYRIYNLQPGEYVVCASPRNTQVPDFARLQSELQMLRQQLASVQASGGNDNTARMLEQRLAAVTASMPQQPETQPTGYAPVCYPGTTTVTEAAPIPLGVGEERPGIDFQLRLVPMARVEGMVVNSTGASIQNFQVMLQESAMVGNTLGITHSARTDNEGRFRFPSVAPGQYKLTVRAQIAGPGRGGPPERTIEMTGGGRGAPAARRPEPVTVWGSTDLVVDGRSVENVVLPVQLGMSLSGQIMFEGATPPPTDLTRMRVTISSADPGPMRSNAAARVDANGRFTAHSLAPGRYRVSASGAPGWFLESATAGGQNALDFPFEVKPNESLAGLTLTFTDRQTELTGTVVDDKSQPAVDYTLVIFPADNRYWTGTTRRIQTVRPATDGRYIVRNLPPGEYKIATVLDIEPGAASDPAFLQQIESATMRLTLQPGEKKQQDIRLSAR